ncbi:hypothetical protein LCGC14_2249770 [marine sediment metagenome]|uniref:Peptidase M24 domain-containing protein n=1 Tax=marine sediment metagenome TaxID=412755 RepID=A0A0F9FXX7_9ZZZZ
MIQANPILDEAYMIKSGRILASALHKAKKLLQAGTTPLDIDSSVEKEILRLGGVPLFKGYKEFPNTICVCVNEDVVHGIPGNCKLVNGDVVTIDIGVSYKSHCTDAARTYVVGSTTPHAMIECVLLALDNGIKKAIVGNTVGDISYAIQKAVYRGNKNYNVPLKLGGHGIGLMTHCPPFIPNYGRRGEGELLLKGLCLAIEPIIFDGPSDVILKTDGWTYTSPTGVLSVHVEDTIIVTDKNPIILTRETIVEERI